MLIKFAKQQLNFSNLYLVLGLPLRLALVVDLHMCGYVEGRALAVLDRALARFQLLALRTVFLLRHLETKFQIHIELFSLSLELSYLDELKWCLLEKV